MSPKKILFITGTRADYGKLKPLIKAIDESPNFDCYIFVTGMHMLARYGSTVYEVENTGHGTIHTFLNQYIGEPMELVLANTISGLSRYVQELNPDMMIVHGDRVETLAGAIVGSIRNILVGHIEGGELSGTIDELIRHSVSKLAHVHFVSNQEAGERILQLGELPSSIKIIGSPDIDVLSSTNLPTLEACQKRYAFPYDDFGILIYHPVTTELEDLAQNIEILVEAVVETGENYLVIYPNNDNGSDFILEEYKKLKKIDRFHIFPSVRFEYFLSFLRHAKFIIGNSSAGVREAPFCGVPTVDVGNRQLNRYFGKSVVNVAHDKTALVKAVQAAKTMTDLEVSKHFSETESVSAFLEALNDPSTWQISTQKQLQNFMPPDR